MTVQQLIVDYKKKHKDASAEEIAKHVRKQVPGARTTPGSVACTLNRAGIRMGRVAAKEELPTYDINAKPEKQEKEESWEDARKRINLRFEAMRRIGKDVISGKTASLIVSGPPGVGKSWTLMEEIIASRRLRHNGLDNVGGGGPMSQDGELVAPGYYDWIGGGCTAVGLYHALWNMRKGGVIVFDDCDDIFGEDDSRNLLKIATDSTKERLVSWRKNAAWLDEYEIEKTFDFKGHIIFITNIDFEKVIERDHKDTEHFKALIDRAAYLCLTLRNARDFMIRIHDVYGGKEGVMTTKWQLEPKQQKEILEFIEQHQKLFYNLSLRLVDHIADRYVHQPAMWRDDVLATKCRTI